MPDKCEIVINTGVAGNLTPPHTHKKTIHYFEELLKGARYYFQPSVCSRQQSDLKELSINNFPIMRSQNQCCNY